MQVEVLKSSMQAFEEMPTPGRVRMNSLLWFGAFEKVRVGVGTCACVIHIGNIL